MILAGQAYATATVTGFVTADGGGSLAGALVRTVGEPGYSAVTGSDGSYTFALPAATYDGLVVSKTGYGPQRTLLGSVIDPSTTTRNFALRTTSAGMTISLPAPLEWGEPPAAPSAPGDDYPVAFADTGALPDPNAPQISEWNDTVKPDESFTLTGAKFTLRSGADAGTDTTVWVWARTSAGNGVLKQARIWRVKENVIVAAMPDDIPFGMYLVWVENSAGASLPICINKTTSIWIGPLGNTVQAGNKKRVFGRNIAQNHGTSVSNVFIQPSAGGNFISCPVSRVEPYMVEFTVPVGTPNGSYKVFAHSGHGGIYGWSDGLDMVVQDDWVRGTTEAPLSPNGSNDTNAIQNAIDAMSALPSGGTVHLSAGNFKIYSRITVKSGVRLLGEGKDQTTIECRQNVLDNNYIFIQGNHLAIQELTILAKNDTVVEPYYGIIGVSGSVNDIKYINMRLTGENRTSLLQNSYGDTQVEFEGCDLSRAVDIGSADGYIHNCNLYGGPYYIPDRGMTEAPLQLGNGVRGTLEYCHVETQNWPNNNGNRNYHDWMAGTADLMYMVWAKRVALTNVTNYYMAHFTTKDVAVDDNKGEMYLFHGAGGQYFGNVLSADGLTLNVRTDGLVDGQVVTIGNYNIPLTGGGPVQDGPTPYTYRKVDGNWVYVIRGKGIGQTRQIVSHTPTSVLVSQPWRIQPDSTSVVMLTYCWRNNVVYANDLNGFPQGYIQGDTASVGVDIDGNGWRNTAEGNTSHRTNSGRMIHSNSGGPSLWNEMRDEVANDCHNYGFGVGYWETNPTGETLFGNAYRNSEVHIVDSSPSGAVFLGGEGSIAEKTIVNAKMGYSLPGVAASGAYPDGLTLFRNGNVATIDGPSFPAGPQPVYVSQIDGKQLLIGNTYSGAPQNYYLATGLSSYSTPVALSRLARFTGYVGSPVQGQLVTIANAGIAAMTWTAAPSDSWITANIQSNGTLSAESTLGRLAISVDTTGMTAGRHWGSVTINTGSSSVKIGVLVDMASGTPPNQVPTASFTATPVGGTSPMTVALNAAASYDLDGSIQSYYWDFGDGSYGSGITTSHQYAVPSVYTPMLTVTDNSGATGTSWTSVTVNPPLSSLALSGNPTGSINTGTAVTLTASAAGGYQVLYKFMLKTDTGWGTLRDYQSGNSVTWTPSVAGYYEVKAYARNTGSTNVYDAASVVLSYPVGLLPTGMKLWLKADAGVTKSSGNLVSGWVDQSGSGNDLSQSIAICQPSFADNAVNGRPVVEFGGGSQMLQTTGLVLSGTTPFTDFEVIRFNSIPGSNYQYIWWNGIDQTSGGYGSYISTDPKITSSWGSGNTGLGDANDAAIGSWYRLSSRWAGGSGSTNHQMWINGNFIGSNRKIGSNFPSGFFSLGNFGPSSYQGFYGDVAEIMIYNRSLTDTERANVESYLSARWSTPTPITKDRLKDVKTLADGLLVGITSPKVVTAASGVYSDGGIYVSESDRTCGMKVLGAGAVSLWDNLTLTGTTDTDVATGERILRVTSLSSGANTPIGTLGMANKVLTASGQLVRVWGKVAGKAAGYITVDDGSGAVVRVQTDGLVTPITAPNIGDYVSATGPCGYMAGGVTAVRVRSGSDIQVY